MSENASHKHLGLLFKCINKRIVNGLNKKLEVYDLTVMQYEVLSYIYFYEQKEDVYQKHIEQFLDSTNPTVTGLVQRLEMKELIHRIQSVSDARYKKLILTDKGRKIAEETLELGPKTIEKRLRNQLTNEQVEQLLELLGLVLEGLEEDKKTTSSGEMTLKEWIE